MPCSLSRTARSEPPRVLAGAPYSDYQRSIIAATRDCLDQQNIPFELITHSAELLTRGPHGCLLVVYTEDHYLSGYEKLAAHLSAREQPSLILTAVCNAEADFTGRNARVRFLHYGGDMLFQMRQYPELPPQRWKNPAAGAHWISLTSIPRLHRVLAACCLLGQDLGHRGSATNRGLLRISPHGVAGFRTWRDYHEATAPEIRLSASPSQERVLQAGFARLKECSHGGQPQGFPYRGLQGLDNAGNFARDLRGLYADSLVEIVNETTFFTKGVFVTEKFLNSVYGSKLPIVLSTPGTVEYLRANGFDMCDDSIDHGYDTVHDPLQRIFAAIQLNLDLLTDPVRARRCWEDCLPRLEKNYQFARHDMYRHFRLQFVRDLRASVTALGLSGVAPDSIVW